MHCEHYSKTFLFLIEIFEKKQKKSLAISGEALSLLSYLL